MKRWTPSRQSGRRSADLCWHLYVIRHPQRDALQAHLAEIGIGTVIHYPVPPHRSEAYAEFRELTLPIAERLGKEVLSLPIGPHVSTADVAQVSAAVKTLVQ